LSASGPVQKHTLRAILSRPELRVEGALYSYLDETNVLALFPEALTADVQAILADQTGFVGADAAVRKHTRQYGSSSQSSNLSFSR
jgi:hypothetical protein